MRYFQIKEPGDVFGTPGRQCKNHSFSVPGLNCWGVPGACEAIWASTYERLYGELPKDFPWQDLPKGAVLPDEFQALVNRLRHVLNLSADTTIKPGTIVGPLHVSCKQFRAFEFLWPQPWEVLLPSRIVECFSDHGFTGWHVNPVVVNNAAEIPQVPGHEEWVNLYALYELVVDCHVPFVIDSPPHTSIPCLIFG